MNGFTYRGADGSPLYAATVGESGRAPGDGGHVVVLLHGGGPDHHSLIPLAQRVADPHIVVLPDVRGYGRSICTDESRHTWAQYADDVIALLDHSRCAMQSSGGPDWVRPSRCARQSPTRIVSPVPC
ncbi:MAG: alpha/beta hydrolase [Longimicrobiaceae bacterium]